MFSAPAERLGLHGLTSLTPQISAKNSGNSAETLVFPNESGLGRTAPSAGVLNGSLAQLVAASPLHGEGRLFDPGSSHHPAIEVPLSAGYVALVSPEDYPLVSPFKWTAMPCGRTVYARRTVHDSSGISHTILLHRVILGAAKGASVDHRDRNGLDCRRHNLRFATTLQNNCNRRVSPAKSGFIGVSANGKGFRGRVKDDRQQRYTKTYPCPILAAAARDVLAEQLHGEFAIRNFRFIPIEATL